MGGRNGLTLDQFARMSDRQILALLQVQWDEESGALVTEWEREPVLDGDQTGSIKRAAQELASPESLGIDDETLRWAMSLRDFRVPVGFLSMWWSIQKKRQAAGLPMKPGGDHPRTDEEIKQHWEEYMRSGK